MIKELIHDPILLARKSEIATKEDLQVAQDLLDTLIAHKDGCDCDEILSLIEQGKIDTTPLITHRFALKDIEKAYEIFENKLDGVIKIAVTTE